MVREPLRRSLLSALRAAATSAAVRQPGHCYLMPRQFGTGARSWQPPTALQPPRHRRRFTALPPSLTSAPPLSLRAGFLTPKAIANRIKSKGLQKLRWYCQVCGAYAYAAGRPCRLPAWPPACCAPCAADRLPPAAPGCLPQMCEKQCRDENGFKCHLTSEGHKRQMEVFGQNPARIIEGCVAGAGQGQCGPGQRDSGQGAAALPIALASPAAPSA